ncbi:hypothetical protein VKT23_017283 [Stygiomarasmius scandens]|uniref:Uncharacterized protein n=1 Tax=Marasmiellus scandens TaxID=2682957 RepID=A0ABR1IVK9_9AGAR
MSQAIGPDVHIMSSAHHNTFRDLRIYAAGQNQTIINVYVNQPMPKSKSKFNRMLGKMKRALGRALGRISKKRPTA